MSVTHQVGDSIGDRYHVTGLLGEGGSGITYQATDSKTGQVVVLKMLSLQNVPDWKAIELFEREAGVLAQLHHEAIPQYLDYFQVDCDRDRAFYIVQALAEGKSLAAKVQQGWRCTEREVRQITIQLLQILVYLHGLTPPVVHRDIKPQNIICRADGRVSLVDFGAVQHAYHNTLMRGSTVVGTFGYMAPEQFRGQTVPATDLYGVGATLLFLLTHRSPADLPSDRLKINFRSHINVSDAFANWLEVMLEPDLEDRFPSAKAALAALYNKQRSPHVTMSSSASPTKALLAVAILSLVAGMLLYKNRFPILSALGFSPRAMYEAIMNGKPETVTYYLDKGVNVNAMDFRNHTPLHWAVTNNKPDMVQLLIDHGAEPNLHYDEDKHTVLHLAVQHTDPSVTRVLLANGAQVDALDAFGYTPLHLAILKLHAPYDLHITSYFGMSGIASGAPSIPVINTLIEYGTNVNASSFDGSTPLDLAQKHYADDVVDVLLQHGSHN